MDYRVVMASAPKLKIGKASRCKKANDKLSIEEVDEKAIKTAKFLEKLERWGQIYLKFKDSRGWIWIQLEE